MPSATRRPGIPALAEGDLSRRTVAKGAAWSVPVIALGAPAAYAAASQLKSGACWLSTLAGTVNRVTTNLDFGFAKQASDDARGTYVFYFSVTLPKPYGQTGFSTPIMDSCTSATNSVGVVSTAQGADGRWVRRYSYTATVSASYVGQAGQFCCGLYWNDSVTLLPNSVLTIENGANAGSYTITARKTYFTSLG